MKLRHEGEFKRLFSDGQDGTVYEGNEAPVGTLIVPQ